MNKKINVVVIGAGRIAGHHCRNIFNSDHFKLKAICDLDLAKANVYADEFKIPAYDNYRKMLNEIKDVDLVTIATPSGMHYEHAEEIITKFKKNVVVEKPTFLKISHLKNIYKLARENKVEVFPVFQNRYNLAVERVKNSLRSEELGKMRMASVRVRWCRPQKYYDLSPWRGTFAMDGGAISNQGIHHIDLLRYLGGEVEEVYTSMRTMGADIEVEDSCVSTLKFTNGAIGTLEITTAARPKDFEASLSVLGANGAAQIGGIAVNELQIFTPDDSAITHFSEDFSDCVYGNGHNKLYQDIALHLNGEKKFPIDETDCAKSIALLHAFYVSHEKNNPVKPADFLESERLGEPNEELANLYRIKE